MCNFVMVRKCRSKRQALLLPKRSQTRIMQRVVCVVEIVISLSVANAMNRDIGH
jgi:hypothetical protein